MVIIYDVLDQSCGYSGGDIYIVRGGRAHSWDFSFAYSLQCIVYRWRYGEIENSQGIYAKSVVGIIRLMFVIIRKVSLVS